MSVQEHETTHVPVTHPSKSESIPSDVPVGSVPLEDSAQTVSTRRITFKRLRIHRTVQNLRKVPEVTMMRILHFSLLIIMTWRRTGVPDMSDSAWLAIKTETQKSDPTVDANSVEPSQDVSNLLVTVSFSVDEEAIQRSCSNPDPGTAFNVMVK